MNPSHIAIIISNSFLNPYEHKSKETLSNYTKTNKNQITTLK